MKKPVSALSKEIFLRAIVHSFLKLNPISLMKNPVIFVSEIGAAITTLECFWLQGQTLIFAIHISIWLWFTVLFANFSESIAESKSKAQADSLKESRIEIFAHRIETDGTTTKVPSSSLKKGDIVLVSIGEIIPADGEIIEGIASIDESSVTGESEPTIRSSGSDRNAVVSGTKVVSDQIKVKISANPGEGYLDRMIHLIEGAKRQRTYNELALTILLSGLTFIFLVIVAAFKIFGSYFALPLSNVTLIALLVCLIPTTIGGLLSAIGIAGIHRLMLHKVLATSGQAIEAAGDVDLILFDKTGTITQGNRQATDLIPTEGISREELARAAYIASYQDETTEGRSIIDLIQKEYPLIPNKKLTHIQLVAFSASTRISGTNYQNKSYRKGAKDSIERFILNKIPEKLSKEVKSISQKGGTPLVVTVNDIVHGVIFLKDVIKTGLREKFSRFREMGIQTVMITGDNEITARTIAKEVGVDSYLAEASPEKKLAYLLKWKKKGYLIAMTGDGVNDAPALAHADVGVAMNLGTQAAKEAGNMVDLDSNPTKLFTIIEIGKQMLMTRGALTTFSIANDLAKYFVILPAMLVPFFPFMEKFNFMHLSNPLNAILSAVIFNALIIVFLIPLAFKGVKFIAQDALTILKKNLLIYGIGGIFLPFLGIKLIDMMISHFHWF